GGRALVRRAGADGDALGDRGRARRGPAPRPAPEHAALAAQALGRDASAERQLQLTGSLRAARSLRRTSRRYAHLAPCVVTRTSHLAPRTSRRYARRARQPSSARRLPRGRDARRAPREAAFA